MVDPVRRFRLERIPDNLLRDPVAFLIADHVRQQKICNALDLLAADSMSDGFHETAAAIADYLSEDFPLHIQDEETDLFESLRVACCFKEDVVSLIDCLTHDHVADLSLAAGIVADLRKLAVHGREADVPHFARLAGAFSATERRHLDLEEKVLLPLAQHRIPAEELERVGRAMARRRGIEYPD